LPTAETRWPAEQELSCGPVPGAASHSVLNNIVREAEKRVCEDVRVDHGMGKDGGWVHLRLCAALLDLDDASDPVDRLNPAERDSIRQMKLISLGDIGVLGRVAVPVDGALLGPTDTADEPKPRD